MPVAAARLAQVLAGDPHPLEPRRVGEHPVQQLAVAGLELVAPLELAPGGPDPGGQRVAHGLQLAEVEGAGAARRGGDARIDSQPREGLGGDRAELALEPADLAAQLLARRALLAADAERACVVSLEQVGHRDRYRV